MRDKDGNPLYMGRKIRNANRAQRRALAARSSGRCEWPGCDVRTGLLPHHSLEWVADQGPTDADVLVNLCRGHHWAVHEGGCRVVPDAEVGFRFYGAAGDEIPGAPAPRVPIRLVVHPAAALDLSVASRGCSGRSSSPTGGRCPPARSFACG